MDRAVHVLLVDDNPDDGALVLRALDREFPHLHAQQFSDQAAFDAALVAGGFDLVITDYHIGWTTGLEVLRSIKTHHPHCPVIMFTGTGSEEIAVEAMKANLDDYIVKSVAHIARLGAAARTAVARSRQRQALTEAELRYRDLFNGVPMGLYQTTPGGQIIDANPTLLQILGYSDLELFCTLNVRDLCVHPDGFELLQHALVNHGGKTRGFVAQLRRYDGSIIWTESCARIVYDTHGKILYHEGALQDISERRSAEARMHYLAHHDDLTGLPNRVMFKYRLEQAIAESVRRGTLLALLLLDMDRFKAINDTLGHAVGDELLKILGERLSGCVREIDTVSRLAGDEFALILPDLTHAEDAARVAQKILAAFAPPFNVDGHELFMSASIGIATCPADGCSLDMLLRNVDIAMYHSKEHGRNTFQFYATEMNTKAFERLSLENALRHALERNELFLHYQPQLDLRTGKIIAVEALLRWQHPELGVISPLQFIPIAEETGMITPIGEWVLRTACAQNKAWQVAGLPHLRVAVNLSPRQLRQSNFIHVIEQTLHETGLAPCYLELELTESMLMHNTENAIAMLTALDAMGIDISIDDFGTGYSSLTYLKRLPIKALKIDKSFVSDIPGDLDDAAIASTIIVMAHNLDIRVIAEGVETPAQKDFLISHACDSMQGYLFSRPVEPDKIPPLLVSAATL